MEVSNFKLTKFGIEQHNFKRMVSALHMTQINNEIGGLSQSPASSAGGSSYPDNTPPNAIFGNSREVTCSGRLVQGILKRGEKVYAGPGENGDFIIANVDSIKVCIFFWNFWIFLEFYLKNRKNTFFVEKEISEKSKKSKKKHF